MTRHLQQAWIAGLGALMACAAAHTDPPPVTVVLSAPSATAPAVSERGAPPPVCAPSRNECSAVRCMYVEPDWLTRALADQMNDCDAGAAAACAGVGVRFALAEGVARDDEKAREILARACAGGIQIACVDRLKMAAAPQLADWSRFCDAGVGEACVEAGLDIGFGVAAATHTPAERARFFERACNLGVANGCVRLGYHYGTGLAVGRDDHRAYELMKMGCDCHDESGCSGVGYLLRDGRGVPQDYGRARAIFEDLCARNISSSCVHLGTMYRLGQGMPADLQRAQSLYRAACDSRSRNPEGAQGCQALAEMVGSGNGVKQSDQRAFELHGQACQGQIATGCGALGIWYRDGRFVAKDPQHALELLDFACNHGDSVACKDAAAMRP